MFICRFLKKRKPKQISTLKQLIGYAVFSSLCIYLWKVLGCVGFSESYLCDTFSPEYILDNRNISSSSEKDFKRLMDLNNFTFLLNNFVCNNSDLILIVLVHSCLENFNKRQAIRKTWGENFSNKFKLLFMLGFTDIDALQKKVNEENETYRDLVQGNFFDSYRNLTYKHVMVLKWCKYFCPNAKYLLKIDDDVFVNTPSFLKYLDFLPETGLIRCMPIFHSRAFRTWRSKWRVTSTEYKYRYYPPYCRGFAILYSSDVVLNLYEQAQVSKYFWIDDVFVTGLLAYSFNYTPTTFGNLNLEIPDFLNMKRKDFNEEFPYIIGPYNMKVEDMEKLWRKARQGEKQIKYSRYKINQELFNPT